MGSQDTTRLSSWWKLATCEINAFQKVDLLVTKPPYLPLSPCIALFFFLSLCFIMRSILESDPRVLLHQYVEGFPSVLTAAHCSFV